MKYTTMHRKHPLISRNPVSTAATRLSIALAALLILLGSSSVWAAKPPPVVYLADQDIDNVFELYSVDPKSGAVTKISAPLVVGGGVLGFDLPQE